MTLLWIFCLGMVFGMGLRYLVDARRRKRLSAAVLHGPAPSPAPDKPYGMPCGNCPENLPGIGCQFAIRSPTMAPQAGWDCPKEIAIRQEALADVEDFLRPPLRP